VINPAIYQFIREEEVGGTRKFIFGKHSGTAAVEAVLRKNEEKLKENRIEITPELVQKVLEKVKIIREKKINSGLYEKFIEEYYRNYGNLGISEDELIKIVREIGK